MILGLDIGGANLKAATSDARAAALAFPLWKSPAKLTDALRTLAAPFGACDRIAVTMTGELADCFATKAEGVARILDSVCEFAGNKPVRVWTTLGTFIDPDQARTQWSGVAAANWHALATWSGRFARRGAALLIDIGSTTTDMIPLCDGVPCPHGRTDLTRLLSGELVYTGVRRTPLCAVAKAVELRGQSCSLAAELFATMLDAYLIAGRMASEERDCDTADGRPATVERAYDRLARMVCCDRTEITTPELQSLAEQFIAAQITHIRGAARQVCRRQATRVSTLIVSGSGGFLARDVVRGIDECAEAAFVELSEQWSPEIAESACALAVASLAEELMNAEC